MKLFTARPPAPTPPNPPVIPGIIVYSRGNRYKDDSPNPDPFRGCIVDISGLDDPEGTACTISGYPGACQLSGLDLADGDEVSIIWSHQYKPVGTTFKKDYGRGPMVYNAASGLLEDTAETMGHDWTASRVYDPVYDDYVDFTPDNNVVYAYVNCTIKNLCVHWDVTDRWPSGATVGACLVPQTTIVSGPYPDYIPYISNFDGYVWSWDWYWEWLKYNDIFR